MKKIIYIFIFILCFSHAAFAESGIQVKSVTNSLPSININQPAVQVQPVQPVQPIAQPAAQHVIQKKVKTASKKSFTPKGAGMTNYQYDDTYYKYNKYEKFIKDNIDYSKTGRTKIY
ncbi:MAG: hypothetical protein K6A44_03765 [bacterium]|nr:hypothetical protein [bacterium]